MNKIKDINQLDDIKNNYLAEYGKYRYNVLVCGGGGCISSNCQEVDDAIREELSVLGLDDKVNVIQTGCMGICAEGPVALILPQRIFYTRLDPKKAKDIVNRHLVNDEICNEYTFFDKSLQRFVPCMDDIEFFKLQTKIVLENCGLIEFKNIDAYIAKDGYIAAFNSITNQDPEKVIQEVEKSGLRGRGGAGFLTGIKLRSGFMQKSNQKYMVCNADEGDPGAFMDRSVIEGDPHSIIEGMILAAFAIGASQGYVYIRAEYPIAIDRLKEAINQAREYGLLGDNIFGTIFSFDLDIRIGAGAFVCGEETALLASIEGQRGEPKQKPPFPFQKGLFNCPTIINNVETLANIPKIIRKGGEWYSGFGLPNATGTKVFALAGDVVNTGIVEVPIGTTIGTIIYSIGGGIPNKKQFKAAQIGGPSGGCVTKENLNTPADYESLNKIGAIMGSGGLIIMNEDACMVDTARFFMDFICDESCGKCLACRVGTKRMLEILERITQGEGKKGDIELLEEIGETIKLTAMCGLGQTAPNPILSTIRFFRQEYEEHINKKYCRAGVCSAMFTSPCENTCPANINISGYVSLVSVGRFQDAYNLIMQENPFPAVCGRICTRPCESKCRRGAVDESVAIRDLKRFVTDYAFKNEMPWKVKMTFPKKKDKKVAIIGAGASGLTCAHYLVNIGYDVDVYESESKPGGVLAYGIPEYRLPKDMLQHEISLIEKEGVKIHLNTEIGKDISFKQLREDYQATYVSTGTQFPQKINIKGENLEGVIHGITFLKQIHLDPDFKLHGRVAVIGGGNTAIDSARTALRIGAERVIVLYRRTINQMPAYYEEIVEAVEEGIEILELTAPLRFVEDENNRVKSIECIMMALSEFDSSGRRKSVEVKGSNFILDVDFVIPAVSQYADLPFIGKNEIGQTKWGTFVINPETMMTTMEGVFAGGDIVRGPEDVINAIADGKKAASSIDLFLGGNGLLNKGQKIEIPLVYDDDEIVYHKQFEKDMLPPKNRKNSFDEVVIGFHKLNAIAESMRCLHCERR
ncbi:MAG: NADH-ubiquinone oxidoreductase-F iron-sulfur binding region domain-containing protein [Bacteroidales bacterium]|nr:NADH-ubiquinone oxidoreductase-F iron-sulfur binding region domain-containing protein [Bacteroidales bacterium]MDD4683682.1 NADH-ubiquinone oxidoreductase-F iron-sulfur binding region domain-containing protein [Bacteroidales bacterium]